MPNAPHWGWYIILYFFLGGLASGLYFVGALAALAGDPRDRPVTRFAYLATFPLVLACAFLLTVDLGKPLRFWHMLFQSEKAPLPVPMLKYWAPMSLGSWILTIFAVFALAAFLSALADSGRLTNERALRVVNWGRRRPRGLRLAWTVLGIFCALFFGGYTGVLLVGTNVPLWHHARLLGAVFLLSAASTAYALLILVLRRRSAESSASLRKLETADRWVIILELVALAILLLTLGGVARPLITGGFGVIFWLGVVGVGLILPLVLPRVRNRQGDTLHRAALGAACVLAGGLLLRFVVIMAPQWPRIALWQL